MAKRKQHILPFRRKLEGKTNYKKRLALLKSNKPRLVVRASLKNILAQIVNFNPDGDKIVVSAHTRELLKLGWKAPTGNIPSAYLVGCLIGKKALSKNIRQAVLDIGLRSSVKSSRCYAVLKGALDAGLEVPCSKEILPDNNRVAGKHIADYAKTVSKEPKDLKAAAEGVSEEKSPKVLIKPEMLPAHFEEFKKKILS